MFPSLMFLCFYIYKDQKFLHSFEDNSDYVYDVQWSPIHPALFASVDGMGRLDLWNLNQDTEVHTVLYKCYIPCAGDSRKYHPEECDYQPSRSLG